jgi:soluble lytic murein transglycosylase
MLSFALLTFLGVTPAIAPPPPDPLIVRAEEALARGNPWRAYRLVLPRTREPRTRTPEVVWLAARSAAEWGGWTQVRTLLTRERWLDSRYEGGPRELLARASLALGQDSAAIIHATSAIAGAASDSSRGVRRVLLARALDRVGRLDEAANAYAMAAGELPTINDWLQLRAATATRDAQGRVRLISGLTSLVAIRRAPVALAIANGGRKQWEAARDAWAIAGDSVEAGLAAAKVGITPELRPWLFASLDRARPDQLPRVVAAIDEAFPILTSGEQLSMARAAVRSGDARRAVIGFERSFADSLGEPEDRLRFGTSLMRAGQTQRALVALLRVTGPDAVVARAQYDRARAYFRLGKGDSALALLAEIPDRFPAESSSANALALAADLAVDAGNDSAARSRWRRLAEIQPNNRFAPNARFQAAMVAYVRRDYQSALAEFDSIGTTPGPEMNAGLYWAGRSLHALGDTAGAVTRWRTIATRSPETYYAERAGRRLGLVPWAPSGSPRPELSDPKAIGFVQRVNLLGHVGMTQEAHWETEGFQEGLVTGSELLEAARAVAATGKPAVAARLARRALAAGPVDSVTAYYIIYPVVHADALAHEAESHDVEPAFSSALIRQESSFDPGALSAAGARGLMQVMPPVGRQLARRLGWPLWDPVLLFEPDVSLELGHYHLANLLSRFREERLVLAAYNAGGNRLAAWQQRAGANDWEVFVERIPYAETRDYVRIVMRNAEYYRRMYDWTCGPTGDVPVADQVAATGVKVRNCVTG